MRYETANETRPAHVPPRRQAAPAGLWPWYKRRWVMLGLSRGEFGLVLFIFVLVWGAGRLPAVAEAIAGARAARRARISGRGS